MDTRTSSLSFRSLPYDRKRMLEGAMENILSNNFDADSKTCIVTLMKILDNILQQPNNIKVRSIRTSNPTFHKKVVEKHGHHILLACGFISKQQSNEGAGGQILLQSDARIVGVDGGVGVNDNADNNPNEYLVLEQDQEDTDLIVATRLYLTTVATQQLGCDPKMLPEYKPPLPKIRLVTTEGANDGTFDVYRGRRYDGQSAAVGTNLGPPPGWTSKADQQLTKLLKQQETLERQLQGKAGGGGDGGVGVPLSASSSKSTYVPYDRQWIAYRLPEDYANAQAATTMTTGTGMAAAVVRSVATLASESLGNNTNNNNTSNNNDGQLLASHFQQLHQKRVAEQNRGFTTKAMRDVERLKQQKVYSHTVLQIQFVDGSIVRGNFRPYETVLTVLQCLQQDVFLQAVSGDNNNNDITVTTTINYPEMELYQTPPRRTLPPEKTLQDLGLVPAAKVYVRWKTSLSKPTHSGGSIGNDKGWFLRPELFVTTTTTDGTTTQIVTTPAMPVSIPVIEGKVMMETTDDNESKNKTDDGTNKKDETSGKRKKTKEEKEASLLARMLGGGGGRKK